MPCLLETETVGPLEWGGGGIVEHFWSLQISGLLLANDLKKRLARATGWGFPKMPYLQQIETVGPWKGGGE